MSHHAVPTILFLLLAIPGWLGAADGPGYPQQTWREGQVLSFIPQSQLYSDAAAAKVAGHAVALNYMWRGYLLMRGAGDSTWDISDPTNPRRLYQHDRGGKEHSTAWIPGTDWVLSGHVYDFSNPTSNAMSNEAYRINRPGGSLHEGIQAPLIWHGQMHYGGTYSRVRLMHWDHEARTSRTLDEFDLRPDYGVREDTIIAVGNLMIILGTRTCATYDISDHRNPRLLDVNKQGRHDNSYGGGIYGTRIFITGDCYDIADPSNIRYVGSYGGSNSVQRFQYHQSFQHGYLHLPGNSYHKVNVQTLETELSVPLDHERSFCYPLGNLAIATGRNARIIAHQAEPELLAPSVTYVNPADGARNQARTSKVGIVLDEWPDPHSIDPERDVIVRPVGGQPIAGTVSVTWNIVNFVPDERLADDTTYEIVLSGIEDQVGNAMDGEWISRFSTGDTLDGGSPAVTIHSPDDGGQHAVGDPLSVDFTIRNWEVAQGGDHYHVFIDGVDQGAHYASGPLVIDDLAAGSHTIAIELAASDHTLTGVRDSVTLEVVGAPSAPSQLAASAAGTATVALTWHDNSADETGLVLQRKTGDGSFATIAELPADTTAYTDGPLDAGTAFTWRVAAVGLGGRSGWSNQSTSETMSPEGAVSLDLSPIPAATDLTAVGTTDWIHWGLGGASAVDRKAGVVARIGDLAVVGGGAAIANDDFQHRAAWSDGSPTGSHSGTPSFVYNNAFDQIGSGFSLSVPATAERQRLLLYLGTYHSEGTLSASLSGGASVSGSAVMPTIGASGHRDGVYVIDFAGAGETLTVTWTLAADLGGAANVQLQAAALRPQNTGGVDVPLAVEATASGPVATGTSASFAVASVTGADGSVEYQWDFGDGSTSTWSSSASASHVYADPGHYSVVLRARDEVEQTSATLRQRVHLPLTAASPSHASTIAYDAVRHRVWNVNPDNDTVTCSDALGLGRLFEVAVAADPRSLCLSAADELAVACTDGDAVEILDPADGSLIQRLQLDHGAAPQGVAWSPDGGVLYIACFGQGAVLRVERAGGAITRSAGTLPWARGLAVSADGSRLVVGRFISSDAGGEVFLLDAATLALDATVVLGLSTESDTEGSGRGLPNYLGQLAISPDGTQAVVPAKKDNIQRGLVRDGQDLNTENTVRTVIGAVDLATASEDPSTRIDFNDSDSATAVAFSPYGDFVFAATQGTNSVEIVNRFAGAGFVTLTGVGRAPQGLCLDPSGTRLFVHGFLSRSVEVYDVSELLALTSTDVPHLASIDAVGNEALDPVVLAGKRLFYDAADPRMTDHGYISCASCHRDGGHDGRIWDFTGRGEGLRNTITLNGRRGTGHGPVHWSGNFDEIHDFEHDIRGPFGGTGFMSDADFAATGSPLGAPKAGRSAALDALAAYVASLDATPRSPHRAPDGTRTAAAIRGEQVFKRLDCASCHSGSDFTDSALGVAHDVGTIGGDSGGRLGGALTGIDTPTLLGVWATAPYLHDGSADTLEAVFATGPSDGAHGVARGLSAADRADLVAYLKQLETGDANPGRSDPDPVIQEPFHGSPALIAASGTSLIEAEDYDLGGDGVAWHDSDSTNNGGFYRSDSVDLQATTDAGGGYNVGWIAQGEWLEYTVDVAQAGTYAVDLRVARQPSGESWLHLVSPTSSSPNVTVPSTGAWQSWTTVSTGIQLAAGVQVLRVALDGDGFNLNWLALTRVAVPGEGDGPILEQDGMVAIELADPHRHEPTSDHAWEPITGLAGTAGEALEAAPNLGTNLGDSTAGAHLVYEVDFATTGTWYVWLRGWGTSGTNDSCHVGLDGQAATFGRWGLGGNAGAWAWYDAVGGRDGPDRVTLAVASPGVHSVDVWMREDGFRIDQMVLTTDATWTPSGQGPAPSPRGGTANTAPVVAAGPDASIVLGEGLDLTGAATDADGDPLTLAWSAEPAAGVSFADATAASTSVAFGAEGSYVLTLSASDGIATVSDSLTVRVAPAPSAGFAAFVNFQPAGSPVPDGYLADTSGLFAARGEHSFGWTSAFDQTRDRNNATAPDQRWDTLNHLQKGGTPRSWEIAVPDGVYRVRLVAGDPAYTNQLNHLELEGQRLADPDGMDHYDEHTVVVEVTDGRLTLAPAADASNAKVCFIEITTASASN